MDTLRKLQEGQIISGSLFNEPMKVETISESGPEHLTLGLVGLKSNIFRRVVLPVKDISSLTILDSMCTYDGNGALFKLGIQAYSLGIAYEFDPYFGLSISRVDPLPHQLQAVYDYFLKVSRVRFLLADDAGAGKTIMAGLLIRELKMRGLVERILVVCPANLTFQWQRELMDKFDEKFIPIKGADIREVYGINRWLEKNQIITSLDLAKRTKILPGLRQVNWDLVIVDEAHRMSWTPPSRKTARYALGELLRDTSDHILLLTATPHKGDPKNFALFLQLLDRDVYADVKSIKEATKNNYAPFYLRRTKEAMVYFPEKQPDNTWAAKKIFTRRITQSAGFTIDGKEFELYQEVTRYVKRQSAKAAARGDDLRARAVGFLMALYQRRLASSIYSLKRSLENRVKRMESNLAKAAKLALEAPPVIPDEEELEEMEEIDRERFEAILEAVTLVSDADQIKEEMEELLELARKAGAIEESGDEAKLSKLKDILHTEGFFDDPGKRLLIFSEFRDTLSYLMQRLESWGFRVGCIHGSMNIGTRDEPGTRLFAEQQFKDGDIQILVATEAAGEGINLQCCNILFNYDLPWNPNRLEQRMGRIHRYGQKKNCLIFNFAATNTIEGRVLLTLQHKIHTIRDALDDDAVFNVVGEVLPASHIERVLRDFYAGKLGEDDLEDVILKDVDEQHFRNICQNALEGLATKKLNLDMLIERRARAQERRVVPETVARFIHEASDHVPIKIKTIEQLPHTFEPGRTPTVLRMYEREEGWKLPSIANKYPRCSTDRETAEKYNLEWVTPGHPFFEALRRHIVSKSQESFSKGVCFYSLQHKTPSRLDIFIAQVVDGLGDIIHKRLFVVEIDNHGEPHLREPESIGNLIPADKHEEVPQVTQFPEPVLWLHDNALKDFLEEIKRERLAELEKVAHHVELSLTELLHKVDEEIGRAMAEVEQKVTGAQGRLAQAEQRHAELMVRRDRRRLELEQQRALSLQSVERITSAVIIPHPDRERPDVQNIRPDKDTEMTAMRIVIEHEEKRGCKVYDVSEKNLGYDVTSLDLNSGELRLIEVKGIKSAQGSILLTPNERRVAEDRRDCYWLYVVTNCATKPELQEPIKDPARFPWHEVTKVAHYYLSVDSLTKPTEISEENPRYRDSKS